MWILYSFASAFFAGITAVLTKVGLSGTDSNLATAVRTVVVFVFSWGIVVMGGLQNDLAAISSKSLCFLVFSGFATGASWLFYFKALQIGDINKVAPVDKSSTILTILLSFLILREPITVNMLVGMTGIAFGTCLMIQRKDVEKKAEGNMWFPYALLSVVFASLTTILAKIGVEGVNSNLATAIRTSVVLVMAWLLVGLQGKWRALSDIHRKGWLFLVLSGLATGFSWLFYYKALQKGYASVVAPIDKLSILVSVLFAYVFFGEKLSRRSVLGLSILVSGTLVLLIKI